MASAFVPTLYLNRHCPFCFKLRVFLLEAGMLDRATIEEFVPGTPEETAMREKLSPYFEKLSFPAARIAEDKYMLESDAIIDWFAAQTGADKTRLPTYNAYVEGPFKKLIALFQENKKLKEQAGG